MTLRWQVDAIMGGGEDPVRKMLRWRPAVRNPRWDWLLLTLLAFFIPLTTATAVGILLPFDRLYELSDIVCIADAIDLIPAPEPTPEMKETTVTYRLRVLRLWKGAPADPFVLRGSGGRVYLPDGQYGVRIVADGGWASFRPGNRYLVFAKYYGRDELPAGDPRSRELTDAKADLLLLRRRVGPGRAVVPDSIPMPAISYRSLRADLDHGDSLAEMTAVNAIGLLGDSAGIAVPALARALHRETPQYLRRRSCGILALWADTSNAARDAYFAALEDPDPAIRLEAAQTIFPARTDTLWWRVLDRRKDPVPEIRAAALCGAARLLSRDRPPVLEYLESMQDSFYSVRKEASRALDAHRSEPAVCRALEEYQGGEDSTLAGLARRFVLWR